MIEHINCTLGNVEMKDMVGECGLYDITKEEFGVRQIRHSCVADPTTEEIYRSFLRGKKIKLAVETGTMYGTGTAILAHYADKVVTIDINPFNNEAVVYWLCCGVMNKIDYYIIDKRRDKADKQQVLNEIGEFDFAFIDGNHRDGVYIDWELLKKCGRVLFHDYYKDSTDIPGMRPEWGAAKESPWIVGLVDSLPPDEVIIKEPFAYWEANGNNSS